MTPLERLGIVRTDGDEVIARLRNVLNFIDDKKPEARLLVLMVNSVIVSSVSAAEETIRQLFQEYLGLLEEIIGSHSRLRARLQESNLAKSVWVLQKLVGAHDPAAVARLEELKKCVTGDADYRLAVAALAYNQANFKSKQVTDIATQIGISGFWDKVLNDQTVADYVGDDVGPQCFGKFIDEWNSVFDERDVVVHRLSQANGWGAARVDRALTMFSLALKRMCAVLAEDAAALALEEAAFLARPA